MRVSTLYLSTLNWKEKGDISVGKLTKGTGSPCSGSAVLLVKAVFSQLLSALKEPDRIDNVLFNF